MDVKSYTNVNMYLLHTDGSKMQNNSVDCIFVALFGKMIVRKNQLWQSNTSIVFTAKVHNSKAVITDAICKGLYYLDVYTDYTRLALKAQNCLVAWHKLVAVFRSLVKENRVNFYVQRIKAIVGHTYNERAN